MKIILLSADRSRTTLSHIGNVYRKTPTLDTHLQTSFTENDPLVDDIITLCSLLSIAKVITARLSWGERPQTRTN